MQADEYADRTELFSDSYAYFSSYSVSWLEHSRTYVERVTRRFDLSSTSMVAEVACNDGYLLQYVRERGVPCFGVEPTASTAAACRARGVDVVQEFFGRALAKRLAESGRSADLLIANNVLAHVPDLNDFVQGFSILLKPHGVATFEFPHLMRLVEGSQFDTIYHEHFSYLSLSSVNRILEENGLCVFDVEELPTHGGSLRVYAQRLDGGIHRPLGAVEALLRHEARAGVTSSDYYRGFQARADAVKNGLVEFLIAMKKAGRTVAAYGAAAKGNTLLNYAGIRPDLIPYVVDRNPAKQGAYLPGSRIPVVSEARLAQDRPDFVLILPWNLASEIAAQLQYARDWGASFVTSVPVLKVF